MKLILFLGLLIILSGCAVLDNTSFETAETIQTGSVKAGIVANAAMDIHKLLDLSKEYEQNIDTSGDQPTGMGTSGIRLSAGLAKNLELVGVVSLGQTQKLSLKYRIPYNSEDLSIAVLPTYLRFVGEYSHKPMKESTTGFEQFTCTGFEMPVLITKKNSPHTSFTLAIKPAYYPLDYRYSYSDDLHGDYLKHKYKGHKDIYSIGISGNIHFSFKYFYLTPMLGIDYINVVDGKQGLLTTGGLGLGIQMYILQPLNQGD